MLALRILLVGLAAVFALRACSGPPPDARIAVATNMVQVMDALEAGFETQTGYEISVSSGSTGQLYAQIVHGAPYDVFMAADQERPRLLVENGLGVPETRWTYARGRLWLWSPNPDHFGANGADGADSLRAGRFRHIAMANPELAPYGVAARDVLIALGLEGALSDRIVMGANIGQTYSLIASGNAEIGFIAAGQIPESGSIWVIPAHLHAPILQDAILLRRGAENPAARDFIAYLQSDPARTILRMHGYEVEG